MQPRQAAAPALAAAQAKRARSAGRGDAELSVLDQPQPGVVELLVLWGETGESREPARLPSAGLAARTWQAAVRGSPAEALLAFLLPSPGARG